MKGPAFDPVPQRPRFCSNPGHRPVLCITFCSIVDYSDYEVIQQKLWSLIGAEERGLPSGGVLIIQR